MKFGLAFSNTLTFAERDGLIELAQAAEAAGFESLWTVEHVLFPDGYESKYPYDKSGRMAMAADTNLPDPLIWLTWVAAVTTKLRLGTGIMILPQRNPIVLAKELGTLDALSGGRVEFGIGVGWLKEEFEALGVPFEGRGARTDEYIEILRTLWRDDSVNHEGELFNFRGISVNPKPANGTLPIHVGGHSAAAARRAGRLGDGFFPAKGNLVELLGIMRESANQADRDPSQIEITSSGNGALGRDPLGFIQEMEALGVHRLIVPAWAFLERPAEALASFGENVIG